MVCIFCIGCTKDYKSHTETYLDNSTSYSIEIQPFQSGAIDMDQLVTINPHERLKVYEDNVWGKTLGPCWATLLQPYDSVMVVFNDERRSKHLRFSYTGSCDYCIGFERNRNITNKKNYQQVVTKEHKRYLNGYFNYTFTEQDYLDARD